MTRAWRPTIGDLRGVPAFASTPKAALAGLLAASRPVTYQPGEALVRQADPSEFALVLCSGALDVVHESARGATSVARITAPALVGELGALAGLARTASMVACEPLRALQVDRAALLDLARHAPDVLLAVISGLGRQIQTMNEALGLFAGGLAALERDELDLAILDDLTHPTGPLANFGHAFGRLAQTITDERRSRGELMSAALIQSAMLPTTLDEQIRDPRCEVFGAMKPARDVGGDFYDAFMLDEDHLAIAIGDVCGKGVPASLFMCATVTTLRLAAAQGEAPSEMIARVNDHLCDHNAASMFSTLFYGVVDLRTRRLDYVNCAHIPPYRFGPAQIPKALAPGGAPLGFLPGRRWASSSLELGPGEGVFLCTDGVTEAVSPNGGDYGEERLVDLLGRSGSGRARSLVAACMDDVEAFADGAPPFDDVTCLAVRLS